MKMDLGSDELINWLTKKEDSLDLVGDLTQLEGGTFDEWGSPISVSGPETDDQMEMMGKWGSIVSKVGAIEDIPWMYQFHPK